MFGKWRNTQNRFQRKGLGTSQFGVCVCPQCNYSVIHKRGIPCATFICPKCHIPLIRQDHPGNCNIQHPENSNIQQAPDRNTKILDFPKVDIELCIGCGTCVDRCRFEAIHLEDGKAKITIANCKKCRACVNVCPVGAIT